MNTLDITKLTDTEVKALAYEQIAAIEQAQNNLRVCNDELNKRLQPKKEEVTEEKPKKK
jgi:hypothetical protein